MGDASPLRALIVDDTPDIRMLLRMALETIGHINVVGEAEDGAEGVRLAGTLHPDVVLLDLAMPVMDGLQATPEIRRASPETKIVILSGFSKDRMEQEARDIGAHAYIEKGTSPKDIVALIRDICRPGPEPIGGEVVEPAVRLAEVPRPSIVREASDPTDEHGAASWKGKIAVAVERALELAGGFAAFGKVVRARVPFDRAGFAVSDDGGFRLHAVCGPEDGRIPVGTVVPIGGRVAATLDKGRSLRVVDTAETDEKLDRYFLDRGIRSYGAVPIRAAGRAQAVVGFSSRQRAAFGEDDLSLLEAAVREAAMPLYMLYLQARRRDVGEQMDEADALKLEWNRILRHDLRSPLTVINGFATMMKTTWEELSDGRKVEFVDAIVRGTDAMGRLLSDMEKVDQIETGSADAVSDPVDLGALVEQSVADIVASSGRSVAVCVQPGLAEALGDEAGQRRVLANLLENAMKFSCPQTTVEVSVTEDNGMIHVSVRDHGVGITNEDQEKLFRKFSRASQLSEKKVPGSGLGLYICRSLVEAQGGRIWVDSAPGAGSTFTYTVPLAASAELRESA
jgi:signal transduction histidine kinase/DNA-binding NarL/FixJ family response regulator